MSLISGAISHVPTPVNSFKPNQLLLCARKQAASTRQAQHLVQLGWSLWAEDSNTRVTAGQRAGLPDMPHGMGGATSVSRAAALALLVLIPMAGARSLLVRGVPQLIARFAQGCNGLAGDTSMLQSLCERLTMR